MDIFGVPLEQLLGQVVLGFVNGCFYAILSLGLAIIFGLLNVINFNQGAFFMMSAFFVVLGQQYLGINYWAALLLVPLVVAVIGMIFECTMLKRVYGQDQLYGWLLTFGAALIIQGIFVHFFGAGGVPYDAPELLHSGTDLGFMYLPNSRIWVVSAALVACFGTWLVIERTKLGSYLRAAKENPKLLQSFGVNVPIMITLTYGFGVFLAAYAGVLATPIMQVTPLMADKLIIVVLAIVVIGGLGSIGGAIIAGLSLGLIEGMTKVYYPQFSDTVVFVFMAIVLVVRPSRFFTRFLAR
jgi:branched-chain amino acid transport system permease protein